MVVVRFQVGVYVFASMSTSTRPYIHTPTGQRELFYWEQTFPSIQKLNSWVGNPHLIFPTRLLRDAYTQGGTLLSDSALYVTVFWLII